MSVNITDPPSLAEINGRLQALVGQRDQAINTLVLQAGQVAQLTEDLAAARARIKELESLRVSSHGPQT